MTNLNQPTDLSDESEKNLYKLMLETPRLQITSPELWKRLSDKVKDRTKGQVENIIK